MTEPTTILKPQELQPAAALAQKTLEQLDRILLGRKELHRLVLIGILSKGHVLLEGLPGLGKTALVRTIGQILRLDFKRIQFTPDLMPGDILGTHILQQTDSGKRELVFQQGPVFTNILLADEINRASPKTQSAMLETMQENSVTLLGTTRMLPQPFFVLASQNPIELEGTYPLPEAQLDRFLFRLLFDHVNADVLDRIISERRRGELPAPTWQMEAADLESLFQTMNRIYLPRPVSRYIARLVSATHPGGPEATDAVTRYVSYGASPRAAIAIAEAARGHALVSGRPTVGFEDVKIVAEPVLNHRLLLNYQARFDRLTPSKLVQELLGQLDETGLKLPGDVELPTGMNGQAAPIQLRKRSQSRGRSLGRGLSVLLLFAMLMRGQVASAAEEFDDISVSPQPLVPGETHHGYREFRVLLRNRSARETYEVTLNYPASSFSGGHSIRRISRTVSMRPGASAVVPLWQPPLQASGSGAIEVLIDGSRAGTVGMSGDFRHMMRRASVRYGGPNPPATILVSRSLNFDELDRKLRPMTGSSAGYGAHMAVGAPDAGAIRVTHPNAWTPDGASSGPHWLELEYATPIAATELRVHGATRMFSGGTITVKGVSGTNLAVLSLAAPTSSRRAEPFPAHAFGLTAEPVKTVRLDFAFAPRGSIIVDAVTVMGPSGSAWASAARASSEMTTGSMPAVAGGMEPRELLRPELPVAEWSGAWISYTPYDAIVLSGTDLSTAPPEVQSALWSYAECGGNLILLGGEVAEPWRSSRATEVDGGGKSFHTGFGRCFLFDTDNTSSLKSSAASAVMDAVNRTARFWQSLPDGDAANASFPVVEDVRIPVRSTVLVMLVFVLLIGPVNLFVLTRMNRRVWMLWTIPVISLATCLLVFVYSFLREGVTPDVRLEGLTLLDQSSRRAVTWGTTAFYSPLTPRQGLLFGVETEATPLVDLDSHSPFGEPSGTPRTVDWTRSQHFQRGWVTARVPAHFQLRKAESHRGRLQVEFSGGKANVMNGLGVPINWLWLADANGRVYQADGIPAGQTTSVQSSTEHPRVTGESGFQGLVSRVPGNSPIVNCSSTNAPNFLLPNTYIAELATDPFLENGLGPKAKSSRTRSRSVVYGLLEKP